MYLRRSREYIFFATQSVVSPFADHWGCEFDEGLAVYFCDLCTSHLQPHPPGGLGKSRDIDFSICKSQVKSLHCRDLV